MGNKHIDPTNENKAQYIFRVFRQASLGKMNKVIAECQEQSGLSRGVIFRDMIHCMRKFGAGYYDYLIFQMWDLTDGERDTYFTRFRSKKLISYVNADDKSHIFDNKDEFNKTFAKYLKREFLDVEKATEEEALEFLARRDKVFCKMKNLDGGKGAELLKKEIFASEMDLYGYIVKQGFATIEDVIENHPEMARIYPGAVNTMRMTTLVGDDGKPYILYAVLKFGRDGRVVDNYGFQGPINLDTGIFDFPAHPGDTTDHRWITKHPNTGEEIVGFKVPFFEESKKLVCEAALEVPGMRYVGWDVATTPNGPAIIEGNNFSAHDFVQLPGQTPDKIGLMPRIKEIVPSFKY